MVRPTPAERTEALLDGEVSPPLSRAPRAGELRVDRVLGEGGMGVVYAAWDPALERAVALKLVREAGSPHSRYRFEAEARLTGQLEHPNIPPVYALGRTEDGRPWFAMRRLEGRTLRAILDDLREGRAGAWTRSRLLANIVQVCQALAFAHARGVVHRDIKPSNLLFGDFGQVFVLDWGIAGRAGERPTERSAGTAGYVAPERLLDPGAPLSPAEDVFSVGAVLYEVLCQGSPEDRAREPDPRRLRPDLAIPDEIAEICLAALAPASRPSAAALADAILAFLDGSRRRAAAGLRLEEAVAAWERYQALEAERAALEQRERVLEREIAPWAPLSEKAEYFAVRARLDSLERVDAWASVLSRAERALASDPDHAPTHRFLADVHWSRLLAAEASGDAPAARHAAARVASHDRDGRYADLLRGDGLLVLDTDPPGAELWCRRYDPRGLVWELGEPVFLGRTPCEAPLATDSYLVEIRAPGLDPTRYPVAITRGRRWEGGLLRLPRPGELAPGFAFIPAGPFLLGGDPDASRPREERWLPSYAIAVLPVTFREYIAFLDALVQAGQPEQAWARCPRLDATLETDGARLLSRGPDGRYALPPDDPLGPWDLDWPVAAVTWEDARAYATWASARDGRDYVLPTEDQWEKAARGVDGRGWPWGDGFDPSLAKIASSRPGTPRPEPVGAFPTDVSVYGVRDMAGSMRCWCADPDFDGDALRRPVKGGSFATNARIARCAVRYGSLAGHPLTYQGFRLAQQLV